MAEAPAGGLRQVMPVCADIVDGLRRDLGRELIDGLLRRAARGAPVVYLAEVGADGALLQWGRSPSGRVAAVQGDGVRLVARPGVVAGRLKG